MRYMTEIEIEKRDKKMRRVRKRDEILNDIFGVMRTIIYTPLSIAFHAISFVARGIGFVSSFGLLAGFYYLYQSFCALKNGAVLGEIDSVEKALAFLILPFIAYGVAVVSERIYRYFENNAF